MVKTVTGNSNNSFKFSDTINGPSGNYISSIDLGSRNNKVNSNVKVTEEYEFDFFSSSSNINLNTNKFPSNNNINLSTNKFLSNNNINLSTNKFPSNNNINLNTNKFPSNNNINLNTNKFPSNNNINLNTNKFPSNNNINFSSSSGTKTLSDIFGNNTSSISLAEDDWIELFYQQMKDKETERDNLWNKWYRFMWDPSVYFDGLYYTGPSGHCCTPEEYNDNAFAIEKFLGENGYPTSDADKPYSAGYQAFEKHVKEEYAPNFYKHFKNYVGMTYDEYLSEISRLDNEVAMYKAAAYSVAQQKKLKPYMQILETEEFKKFETNTWNLEYFSRNYADLSIPTGNKVSLLDETDKRLFFYLKEKKGESVALQFLEANEDKINQAEGKREAEEYLARITNENGEIDYGFLSGAITAGKGLFDGIESFGEGLANIFADEAMISDNQYAQMYILDVLNNPEKRYLDNIINELARVESFRTGSSIVSIKKGYEFYNRDGSINLEYAKGKLTAEQYNKLLSIKSGVYDDIYQISSSIGNMIPSIAVSAVLSIVSRTLGSVVGSVLMGASSGGNAKMAALVSGNDKLSATLYGLMSGLSEASLGLLLGNIPGLNANAKLALEGIVGEGTEELIQTFVDAGLRSSLLGEDINISELYGEGGKSFVYGMITSAIMNGGKLACNIAFNDSKVHISSIDDLANFVSVFNSDKVTVKKINGKDAIVFNNDADIDSKTINKIKQIFPDVEIQQVVSNSGATIEYSFKTIDDVPIDFFTRFENPENVVLNINGEKYSYSQLLELAQTDVTALLAKATTSDILYNYWDVQSLSGVIHNLFDEMYGYDRIQNEVLNKIQIVDASEWKQLCKSRGLGDNILGFVDSNSVMYLPSNANMHTAIHEAFHKISELNGLKVYDSSGNIRKVTGIREFYIDGFDSNFANETLTEYLSSKYSDGKIYSSMYGESNVVLWNRIDEAIKKVDDRDLLALSYFNNDTSYIREFFDKYGGKGSYDQFVRALDQWYSSGKILDNIVTTIEKNIYKEKHPVLYFAKSIFGGSYT